ncbi:MAG: hypothetical protein H6834_05700 [Planctomycetes bacterium]|nr:hypothetical protein [Planctomycetota bacterium]MCB9890887.1 hypothetical protein [Planctomycetota bacterium]
MHGKAFEQGAGVAFQDVLPGVEVARLMAIESGVPVVQLADGTVTRSLILAGALTTSNVGARVLVVQPAGTGLPVVLGLVRETIDEDAAVSGERQDVRPTEPNRKVRIEATGELDLRCGEASLSMRRNGKIVLRGVEIVSRASRANKVKGGTVRIN